MPQQSWCPFGTEFLHLRVSDVAASEARVLGTKCLEHGSQGSALTILYSLLKQELRSRGCRVMRGICFKRNVGVRVGALQKLERDFQRRRGLE